MTTIPQRTWSKDLEPSERFGLFALRAAHTCSYHPDRAAVAEMHSPSAFLYYCKQCAGIKEDAK